MGFTSFGNGKLTRQQSASPTRRRSRCRLPTRRRTSSSGGRCSAAKRRTRRSGHLKLAPKELPQQRELTAMFADVAMAAAETGQGDRVTEILTQDEFGSKMEPLLVALRIKRGDKPVVVNEVMEVALDIANGAKGSKRTTSKLAE
jgi:hypothetical protein